MSTSQSTTPPTSLTNQLISEHRTQFVGDGTAYIAKCLNAGDPVDAQRLIGLLNCALSGDRTPVSVTDVVRNQATEEIEQTVSVSFTRSEIAAYELTGAVNAMCSVLNAFPAHNKPQIRVG